MLYIRVDMNDVIATGHVMRCLAIADAARTIGENTAFLLADEQAVSVLEKRGYPYIVLHTLWNEMDSELAVMEKIIEQNAIKRMLVDTYQVTEHYLEKLSAMVEVIYLDDLNTFVYPVHGIICYANYWEKFRYKERYKNINLYLGTEYAPLRGVFSQCEKKEIKPQVECLLILSGGTDKYHILEQILRQINRKMYQQIDVICGMYYLEYEELVDKYAEEKNVCIHRAVNDMERYMKAADLVISAGGTTLYELCACGTPTISFVVADNQLENVGKFQEDGLIDCAGDVRKENVPEKLVNYLKEYHCNQKLRQERSVKMQTLIDGKGALRIAEILLKNEG